jgi:hypothetical protein
MRTDVENFLVENALNGTGDSVGDDDFGVSYGWLDLEGDLDTIGFPEDILEQSQDEVESRFAIISLDKDGFVSWEIFDEREEMMEQFREYENAYVEFIDR